MLNLGDEIRKALFWGLLNSRLQSFADLQNLRLPNHCHFRQLRLKNWHSGPPGYVYSVVDSGSTQDVPSG